MSRFPNCSVRDCDAVAFWQPVVLVWEKGQNRYEDEPVRVKLQPKICAVCMQKFRLSDFVDEHLRRKTEKFFDAAEKQEPNIENMKLDWAGISGKKVK